MSLDKLIAAATDYFTTGADVHRATLSSIADHQNAVIEYHKTSADVNRRALAGGGGKITDMSEPKVGTTSDSPANKPKAEKPKTEKPAPVQPDPAPAAKVQGPEVVTDVVAKPEVYNNTAAADDLDGGTPTFDYEADIRPLLRAKTLTNREGLIALLGTFGVKSGAELTAAQYPAFFAGLKAL
jgi:hypothetical protein